MKRPRDESIIVAGVAVIFVASFLVYWPALQGAFIWDDLLNIDRNPLIRADSGLLKIWLGQGHAYDYYPLTWTTWWLEWRSWGRATTGYHVLNVILHAGTAAMLWRVLARLAVPGAFVAALVFAVHPVNVESVAWISERKNTLSMCLAATSFALYLDGRASSHRRMYWASVCFFALALLAKPSVVMLPAVMLVVAWWKNGKVSRTDVRMALPFAALSAVISVVTVCFHHVRGIGSVEIRSDGIAGRLAGAGMAVWFYLQKLAAPVHLSFVYPRWAIDSSSIRAWAPLAALAGVFALAFFGRKLWGRGPMAALASFVAMLAPVLGFIDVYFMRFSYVADHWQYPACIAVIALVVAAVASGIRRISSSALRVACGGFLAVGVCGGLARVSWRAAHLYDSPAALWADAVAENPRGMLPLTNYANELWGAGHFDEARVHFLRAIDANPNAREPYSAMGQMYEYQGRFDDAVKWYRLAIEHPGAQTDPRILLAGALRAQGKTDEAIQWYEQSLAAGTDDGLVFAPLGMLYQHSGRTTEALEQFRASVRRWPDDPEDRFILASALLASGQSAEADQHLGAVRRLLAKDDHVAINSFGVRLITGGHYRQAAAFFEEIVRIKPDYAQAHNNLGKALEGMGQLDAAAAQYDRALVEQPGFREARLNLDRVLAARATPTTATSPSRQPNR